MKRIFRAFAWLFVLWQLAGLGVLSLSLRPIPQLPAAPSGAMDDESTRLAASINVPLGERLSALHELAREQYDAGHPLAAWRLFRLMESEIGPNDASGMWGTAVYNQGLALNRAGFSGYARKDFERLIASRVNDSDPGALDASVFQMALRVMSTWSRGYGAA